MAFLHDKTALVTGGARGIGRAVCLELAARGSKVVVVDLDLEQAKETAEAISRNQGVSTLAVQADVSSAPDVKKMLNEVKVKFPAGIDILVNNAGITRDNLLMRMREDDWDNVININLKSAFLCTKGVIRTMMKKRCGKIINISSVVGVMGNAGQSNYAASKAGMIGLTKSVAREAASRNIQVNAVAPGYIETEMTKQLDQEVRNEFLETIPAKRGGTVEDVARVVSFLASPASDYITGQVLNVDGGMLIA